MIFHWLRIGGPLLLALLALYGLGRALRTAEGHRMPQARVLVALRLTSLIIVFLMLLNPAVTRLVNLTHKPSLLLLLDASASMNLPAAEGLTRWQALQRTLADDAVKQALKRFTVRWRWYAEGLLDPPAEPTGSQTDLALALRQALAEPAPNHTLIISDGAETRGDSLQAVVHTAAGRLHTIGVGSPEPPPDLGPLVLQAPRVVRENTPFELKVSLAATGITGTAPVAVDREGKPLGAVGVALGDTPGRGTLKVSGLPAGFHLLTTKTAVRPGEASAANNRRTVLVEARRDKTRLLFVAGAPSPDYAALKRVAAGLPKTEADFYARVTKTQYLHEAGESTRRTGLDLSRQLKGRHVVLLMDVEASGWGKALEEFVLAGGALGVLAGRGSAGGRGLEGLLPAALGSYRAVPLGLRPPVAASGLGEVLAQATVPAWWTGAPYLSGQLTTGAMRAGAEVVLRGTNGTPLLLARTVGQGRTLLFAGEGTYRWILSGQADAQSSRLHEIMWQTILNWLGSPRGDRQILLMLDPPVLAYGQPARALVQLSRGPEPVTGVPVAVRVTGKGLDRRLAATPTSVPGRYQVGLADLPAGEYVVRADAGALGSTERRLVVEPGGAESASLTLQEGRLRALAQAGGGQYVTLSGLAGLLESLPHEQLVERNKLVTRPLRTWWAFLVVLALCTAEWLLRRRWGW